MADTIHILVRREPATDTEGREAGSNWFAMGPCGTVAHGSSKDEAVGLLVSEFPEIFHVDVSEVDG